MGSGFNFFTNAIDKTPATAGAWVDVDVSGDVPSGATGVALIIRNTGTAARICAVRKNGSTDDLSFVKLSNDYLRSSFVGLDSNRIFEAYIENTTDLRIFLIGYTDENVGFFTNVIDVTPTPTAAWTDIDASPHIPSGSTGVICQGWSNGGGANEYIGIRKNGSTDNWTNDVYTAPRVHFFLCGVDANRIFEGIRAVTQGVIKLVGYTKSPVTFFTNGIDKSLSQTSQWLDIDVTLDTDPNADGAIVHHRNASTTIGLKGHVRKNGSSDNFTGSKTLYGGTTGGGFTYTIGMDSGQVFEGWIDNVAVDFYLIGYCKPSVTTYTKNYNADTLFKKPNIPKTYSSDVLIQKKGIPKTYASDVLIKKPDIPKTYTSDVLIQKRGIPKTYPSNVLLKKPDIPKTYPSNVLLKKPNISKTYSSDILVQKQGITKTYLADVILTLGYVTYTKQYGADILIKKLNIAKTYPADVLVKKLGITKAYSADVIVAPPTYKPFSITSEDFEQITLTAEAFEQIAIEAESFDQITVEDEDFQQITVTDEDFDQITIEEEDRP